MAHEVFVSFSKKDKYIADDVVAGLENNGISCWIAPRDVAPGESWAAAIVGAIEASRFMVIILSSNTNQSAQVVREVERAVVNDVILIPFRIEDIDPGGGLAYYLGTEHWLDAFKSPLENHIEQLVNLIQSIKKGGSESVLDISTSTPARGDISQYPTVKASDSRIEQHEPQKGKSGSQPFDVFISYRRATDSQTARLIRSELQHRGYKVFLDVDDLRPGHFDEALLNRIEEAKNFILILSEGALERCAKSDDWMRKEILCALSKKKTIIPIMMPGFNFPTPEEISSELQPLLVHHSIRYSHDFFDAMIEKIAVFMSSA
jgi:hypothetical protein